MTSNKFDEILTRLIQNKKHHFVTGAAGTGKSTLLRTLREKKDGNVVVLAPTGLAAVNVKGQTIHSFFGFGHDSWSCGKNL